jgi:hypothetical protein
MNRRRRRATKRKVGDVIRAIGGRGPDGNYYWFEAAAGYRQGDQPPPGTQVYGPFATEAESNESQRLVLLGPQCEVIDGGAWNPAWDRMQ